MRRKEENKNIIEIKEEVQIGDVVLEEGDRIRVLKENKINIDLDQFIRDVEGRIAWATLYTQNPISRTDIKDAEVKILSGGISIKSNSGIAEFILDEGNLEFFFDTLNPTNYIYSAYNPRTEWLLKLQKK